MFYGGLASGQLYTQPDPIGIDGGPNAFLYAKAQPTGYVDIDGLQHRNPAVNNPLTDSDLIGGGGGGGGRAFCPPAAKGPDTPEKGGLNLFKWGKESTTKPGGWKEGDFMLHLPNKGGTQANWEQNAGRLREQMRQGNPISDSYRDPHTGKHDGTLLVDYEALI